MISLAGGIPDAALFPHGELAELAASMISNPVGEALQYGETAGSPVVRAALAAQFGPDVDPTNVVVTTGSQQALHLFALALLRPGDDVVVGDPDYLGALQVFRSTGARLHGIPIDQDGLDTVALERQLRRGLRPACCYYVPSFHNPTGATMSHERRRHLYDLAQRYEFLLLEDDPYRDLYFGQKTLHVSGPERFTVALRSTSKVLAPGLRVGALHGPEWVVSAVVKRKQSVDLHTSALSQSLAAAALTSDWFPAHLSMLRRKYATKRDVLLGALDSAFGDSIDLVVPGGGMFAWVTFHGIDTTAWLPDAIDRGVCFVPGAAFSVDEDFTNAARLCFASASHAELERAVEILSETTRRRSRACRG